MSDLWVCYSGCFPWISIQKHEHMADTPRMILVFVMWPQSWGIVWKGQVETFPDENQSMRPRKQFPLWPVSEQEFRFSSSPQRDQEWPSRLSELQTLQFLWSEKIPVSINAGRGIQILSAGLTAWLLLLPSTGETTSNIRISSSPTHGLACFCSAGSP